METKPHSNEQKRMLRNIGRPKWSLVWQFLVCSLLLDALIWGYFTFVEKVPVLVGLQKIQDGIRGKREKKKTEPMAQQIVKFDPEQTEKKVPSESLIRFPPEEKKRNSEAERNNYIEKEKFDKHVEEVDKMVAEAIAKENRGKYSGTMYSWIDKEGKRTISNIGFPQNEEYRNGKIERF